MRVEFSGFVDDTAFGSGGASAHVNDLRFAAYASCFCGHRANEVNFDLQRCVTCTGR